jgi:hypothetical protein
MKTPIKKLVDEREMAGQLAVSWRHLMELRKKRLVPHVRLGRLVRYAPEQVFRAIEKLTIESL